MQPSPTGSELDNVTITNRGDDVKHTCYVCVISHYRHIKETLSNFNDTNLYCSVAHTTTVTCYPQHGGHGGGVDIYDACCLRRNLWTSLPTSTASLHCVANQMNAVDPTQQQSAR